MLVANSTSLNKTRFLWFSSLIHSSIPALTFKIAAEDKKSSAACASNRTSARFYKAGFLQGRY